MRRRPRRTLNSPAASALLGRAPCAGRTDVIRPSVRRASYRGLVDLCRTGTALTRACTHWFAKTSMSGSPTLPIRSWPAPFATFQRTWPRHGGHFSKIRRQLQLMRQARPRAAAAAHPKHPRNPRTRQISRRKPAGRYCPAMRQGHPEFPDHHAVRLRLRQRDLLAVPIRSASIRTSGLSRLICLEQATPPLSICLSENGAPENRRSWNACSRRSQDSPAPSPVANRS